MMMTGSVMVAMTVIRISRSREQRASIDCPIGGPSQCRLELMLAGWLASCRPSLLLGRALAGREPEERESKMASEKAGEGETESEKNEQKMDGGSST